MKANNINVKKATIATAVVIALASTGVAAFAMGSNASLKHQLMSKASPKTTQTATIDDQYAEDEYLDANTNLAETVLASNPANQEAYENLYANSDDMDDYSYLGLAYGDEDEADYDEYGEDYDEDYDYGEDYDYDDSESYSGDEEYYGEDEGEAQNYVAPSSANEAVQSDESGAMEEGDAQAETKAEDQAKKDEAAKKEAEREAAAKERAQKEAEAKKQAEENAKKEAATKEKAEREAANKANEERVAKMTNLTEDERTQLVKLYNKRDALVRAGKEIPEKLTKRIQKLENKANQPQETTTETNEKTEADKPVTDESETKTSETKSTEKPAEQKTEQMS